MCKQECRLDIEQKLTIVLTALRNQQNIPALAKQYGVNENQIYLWKEQFLYGGRQGLTCASAPTADWRLDEGNRQRQKPIGKALDIDNLKQLSRL